jgi:adenine deaminase
VGAALFALGFVLLFANLDAVASSVSRILGTSQSSGMEAIPALILATSHAAQAYAFDHQGFLSVLQQILVSFWPLILVVIGAVLLRGALLGQFTRVEHGASSPAAGERS